LPVLTPVLASPLPDAAGPAAPPLAARIRATFVSPQRLARSIAHATPWFDVLLLVVAAAIVALFAVPDEFYVEQVRDAVDRRGRPVEITSDPSAIARWNRYLGMLTALVQWPLLVMGTAGLLHLLFGAGRGRLRFAQMLSLTAHAFLILAIQQLLLLGASLAGVAEPSTSLAALLPFAQDGGVAASVLDLVDPFTIWMLVVLGIGVAALDTRMRARNAVLTLTLGYFALAVAMGFWMR
jgi:hypothetical protein